MLFSLVQLFHLFAALAYYGVFDYWVPELGARSNAYDGHMGEPVMPNHGDKLLTDKLRRLRQFTKLGHAHRNLESNGTKDADTDPYRVGQCPLIAATGGKYGKCFGGVSAPQNIWTDRSYQFIKAPGDLLGGEWAYQQVELEGNPPCHNEGGFKGKVEASGSVVVCLSTHCENNEPTGPLAWQRVGRTYSVSNHGGDPCKFYQSYVEAGRQFEICGSNCWASGIFYRKGSETGTQLLEDAGLHTKLLHHIHKNHFLLQLIANAGLAIVFGIFGAYMWFSGGIRARGKIVPFPQGPRSFPDGLFNFTQDMNSCLLACFCNPVANSEVAYVISALEFWPSMIVLCGSLLLPYGLSFVVMVGFRFYTRQVFRQKASFADECFMDFLYSCLPCLQPCTTCQELRYIKKLRSGYASVGPAVGVTNESGQTLLPEGKAAQPAVPEPRGLEGQPISPPPDAAGEPADDLAWGCCSKRWF